MPKTSVQVQIGGRSALVVADGGTMYTLFRDGARIAVQKDGRDSYWINRLGICSCPAGQNGKPCKHLGWAEDLTAQERCQAGRDGECVWPSCPQNRDGEPTKSGRHCPIDLDVEEREHQ